MPTLTLVRPDSPAAQLAEANALKTAESERMRRVRGHLEAAVAELRHTRDQLSRFGDEMSVRFGSDYHDRTSEEVRSANADLAAGQFAIDLLLPGLENAVRGLDHIDQLYFVEWYLPETCAQAVRS